MEKCCYNQKICRLVGLAIGWLGIMIGIMVIKVFTQQSPTAQDDQPLKISIYDNIIVIVSASNFLACCIWLFSMRNDNTGLMRITLFWWGINMCLDILGICCYFFENPREFFQTKLFLLFVTVYWIFSLTFAVLCFKSKKEADRRDPKNQP